MEQRLRLGQLLVDASIISQEQLDDVLLLQEQDGRKLGTLLVERELINETQLTQILSQQLAVPWVSLYHVDFSRRLLSLVPREVAEKFCLVPIYVRHVRGQGDTLYVAMDDPTNDEALKACSMWAGLPTRAMIASPTDVRNAIRVYYQDGRRASVPPVTEGQAESPSPTNTNDQAAENIMPPPDDEKKSSPGEPPQEPVAATDPKSNANPDESSTDASVPIRPEEPSVPPEPESAAAWTPASADAETAVESAPSAHQEAPPAEDSLPAPAVESGASGDDHQLPSESGSPAVNMAPIEPAQSAEDDASAAPAVDASTSPTASGDEVVNPTTQQHDDQVTLEVGAEISLEEILPEGKTIPRKHTMTGAERLMSLTLLDGTTLALPVRRAARKRAASTLVEDAERQERPATALPSEPQSHPPSSGHAPSSVRPVRLSQPPTEIVPATDFTARDVVAALRAAAHGVDPTDILGVEPKWQAVLAALLSLMLRKGLIDEQDFVDELKKV
jgi:hypothetical protein